MRSRGVGTLERIALGKGVTVERAIQAVANRPGVVFAEPNFLVTATATSNDPYYTTSSRLWGMYGDELPSASGPSGTTNQFGSQAGKAWDAGYTGPKSVVVGIIDEGIDISHPDLAGNIWVNPGEIAGDGLDNDGNGYVDDINGWDFVRGDNTVYDAGDESNESLSVVLSAASANAAIKTVSATGTITNDDAQPAPPRLAISSVSALESVGAFVFTVTLSSPSTTSVSVRFATSNGTATSSGKTADYSSTSGTLTFNPGETTKTISVAVKNDTAIELDETFFVNLSRSSGASIAVGQGIGTIRNDDGVVAAAFASFVTAGATSPPKRR